MSLPSQDLEELKGEAERLTKQLPRSSSKDEALEVAIEAAELSMQALKLAQDKNEKAQLSTRVRQLLNEAEKIKHGKDWRKVVGSTSSIKGSINGTMASNNLTRTLNEPKSSRDVPTSEQILLLKAGYLNGFKFPPWTTPPDPNEFESRDGEELFLYVSLVFLLYCHRLTVTPQPETRQTYLYPSFKKKCSMTGNALPMPSHHRHGFPVTAPISDLV